jgi:hypothetical protein
MKELAEIERTYIKDIVEFFCIKSMEIFQEDQIGQSDSFSYEVKTWIESKIRKRLLETGIITDYMIVVNFYDIVKTRDMKIEQLLGTSSIKPKNTIEVSVRYGNRDFETFEFEII